VQLQRVLFWAQLLSQGEGKQASAASEALNKTEQDEANKNGKSPIKKEKEQRRGRRKKVTVEVQEEDYSTQKTDNLILSLNQEKQDLLKEGGK